MYKFNISDEIGEYWGFNTKELEMHLDAANGDDIFIDINSAGGDVDIGLAIYAKLRRYAKEHNAEITTRTDGMVYSIATIIFLAGDRRIVNEYMQPFIHEPWSWSGSETADEYQKMADMLEQVKNILAGFYANHTTLSFEEAMDYMEADTWLTAEECLEIGFATEIEKLSVAGMRLAAFFKTKFNKMSKKHWTERLAAVMSGRKVKNQMELADVSGNPVIFPNLEEGDTPAEGDAVVVDGDANYTGTVELTDYTLEVEDGVVTSVREGVEEIIEELIDIVEELEEEIEAKNKEIERYAKLVNTLKKGGKSETKSERRTDQEEGEKEEGREAMMKLLKKYKRA